MEEILLSEERSKLGGGTKPVAPQFSLAAINEYNRKRVHNELDADEAARRECVKSERHEKIRRLHDMELLPASLITGYCCFDQHCQKRKEVLKKHDSNWAEADSAKYENRFGFSRVGADEASPRTKEAAIRDGKKGEPRSMKMKLRMKKGGTWKVQRIWTAHRNIVIPPSGRPSEGGRLLMDFALGEC